MTSLAERTVLVTGANRGMGREYVAQLLSRKVAKVYAATRNPLAIDVSDPRVIPLQLDVTDAVSVAEAADLATDVGILINNAGISRASSVLDKDTSALRGELETNLFGPLALASAFADRIADEIRCHRQRFLGTRLASPWHELWSVQGGDVERDGVDAYRAGAARCAGGGRLRGAGRHRHGSIRRRAEVRSCRCGPPGARRNRGWQGGRAGRRDEPSGARVAECPCAGTYRAVDG